MVKNAVEDSFTGLSSRKGAHGANASAHFDEQTLDHIGAAQSFPEFFRCLEKVKE